MSARWKVLSTGLACCLSACFGGDAADLSRFANDYDETAIQDFVKSAREGRFDDANMLLALGLHDSIAATKWEEIRAALMEVDLDSLYLIGAFSSTVNGSRAAQLTYEGPAGMQWLRLGFSLFNGSITGISWNQSESTLAEENAFRLSDLSLGRIAIILAGLVSLIVSLTAFGLILRSTIPRRPLWAVASLLGVGGCVVNWSAGSWVARIMLTAPVFQIQRAGPFAPWLFSAFVPLGAIIAITRLRSRTEAVASAPVDTLLASDEAL